MKRYQLLKLLGGLIILNNCAAIHLSPNSFHQSSCNQLGNTLAQCDDREAPALKNHRIFDMEGKDFDFADHGFSQDITAESIVKAAPVVRGKTTTTIRTPIATRPSTPIPSISTQPDVVTVTSHDSIATIPQVPIMTNQGSIPELQNSNTCEDQIAQLPMEIVPEIQFQEEINSPITDTARFEVAQPSIVAPLDIVNQEALDDRNVAQFVTGIISDNLGVTPSHEVNQQEECHDSQVIPGVDTSVDHVPLPIIEVHSQSESGPEGECDHEFRPQNEVIQEVEPQHQCEDNDEEEVRRPDALPIDTENIRQTVLFPEPTFDQEQTRPDILPAEMIPGHCAISEEQTRSECEFEHECEDKPEVEAKPAGESEKECEDRPEDEVIPAGQPAHECEDKPEIEVKYDIVTSPECESRPDLVPAQEAQPRPETEHMPEDEVAPWAVTIPLPWIHTNIDETGLEVNQPVTPRNDDCNDVGEIYHQVNLPLHPVTQTTDMNECQHPESEIPEIQRMPEVVIPELRPVDEGVREPEFVPLPPVVVKEELQPPSQPVEECEEPSQPVDVIEERPVLPEIIQPQFPPEQEFIPLLQVNEDLPAHPAEEELPSHLPQNPNEECEEPQPPIEQSQPEQPGQVRPQPPIDEECEPIPVVNENLHIQPAEEQPLPQPPACEEPTAPVEEKQPLLPVEQPVQPEQEIPIPPIQPEMPAEPEQVMPQDPAPSQQPLQEDRTSAESQPSSPCSEDNHMDIEVIPSQPIRPIPEIVIQPEEVVPPMVPEQAPLPPSSPPSPDVITVTDSICIDDEEPSAPILPAPEMMPLPAPEQCNQAPEESTVIVIPVIDDTPTPEMHPIDPQTTEECEHDGKVIDRPDRCGCQDGPSAQGVAHSQSIPAKQGIQGDIRSSRGRDNAEDINQAASYGWKIWEQVKQGTLNLQDLLTFGSEQSAPQSQVDHTIDVTRPVRSTGRDVSEGSCSCGTQIPVDSGINTGIVHRVENQATPSTQIRKGTQGTTAKPAVEIHAEPSLPEQALNRESKRVTIESAKPMDAGVQGTSECRVPVIIVDQVDRRASEAERVPVIPQVAEDRRTSLIPVYSPREASQEITIPEENMRQKCEDAPRTCAPVETIAPACPIAPEDRIPETPESRVPETPAQVIAKPEERAPESCVQPIVQTESRAPRVTVDAMRQDTVRIPDQTTVSTQTECATPQVTVVTTGQRATTSARTYPTTVNSSSSANGKKKVMMNIS